MGRFVEFLQRRAIPNAAGTMRLCSSMGEGGREGEFESLDGSR